MIFEFLRISFLLLTFAPMYAQPCGAVRGICAAILMGKMAAVF